MSNQKRPVSPVEEFIKAFHEMSARYGRSELWYDYIDMHAIALANTCDLRCRDTREEQYNAIVQKYDEKTVQQFAVLTAITMTALLENPEQDFLGTVYHNLGLSKSQAGQFFTPSNVGQVPYPAGERPVLWCRMPASGGVQCDARAVGIH